MGNSRNLPKYERSVATEVVAQPNMQEAGALLINSFRQFSNLATDVATQYNRQEASGEKEIIKNNISNAYKSFSLDSLKMPDQNKGLEDYNEKHQQYSKGMIAQANPFNKAYVTNLTDYYYNQHIMQVERNAIQQNKNIAEVNFAQTNENATNDVMHAIDNAVPTIDKDGNDVTYAAATALHVMQLKNLKEHAIKSNPAYFRIAEKELNEKFYTALWLNKYQRRVAAGHGDEFIAEVLDPKTEIPGFDTSAKSKLAGQMIKINQQNRTARHLSLGNLTVRIKEAAKRVEDGGMEDARLTEDINQNAAEHAEKYNSLMATSKSIYAGKQAAKYMTPSEINDFVERIKPVDPNSQTYVADKEKWEKTSAAIYQQQKEFKANPMTQTLEDPTIQNLYNNYEQAQNVGAVGSNDKLNTPFSTYTPKPWDSVIRYQTSRGLTLNGKNRVKLFDNSQVSERVNAIVAASPVEKLRLMNKWNDEFGGGLAFNLATKQLVEGGMPAQYTLLANIDPNSPQARDAAEAFSIPIKTLAEELRKKDSHAITEINNTSSGDVFGQSSYFGGIKFSGTDSFKSFMNTTSRYSGQVDREYNNNIATTVQQLAYYYALTKSLSSDDAVSKAEDVIGQRYDYTSLNNHEIRLPKNISQINVKNYAVKMEGHVNSFGWNLGRYDKDIAKELIKQGHWKNDTVDHGLVWVDANDKLWTDKNGHPLAFSFNEATTGVPDHVADNRLITQTENDISNPDTDLAKDPALMEIDKKGAKMIAAAKKHTYRSLIGKGDSNA